MKTEKNNITDNFLLLPNNLVWDVKGTNNTLVKKYGDKIVHIIPYLIATTNYCKKTIFSLNDLILTCRLIPKSGKHKSIEQFKDILVNISQDKIITQTPQDIKSSQDIKDIRLNNLIKCEVDIPIKKNKDGETIEFFTISYTNYLSLMDDYTGSLDMILLLKIYFYINARISRRYNQKCMNDETGEIKIEKQNIGAIGIKQECFFDTYKNICTDLNISKNTFKEYINELQKLQLIFYGNIGKIYDDFNGVREASNIYCLDAKELKDALRLSEVFYKDNGYIVLGKNYDKQQRKITGLKGKIKQEQNKGKNTSILENKLANMEGKLENKIIPLEERNCLRIKSLLNEPKYENMLLSEIYLCKKNKKLKKKYFKLEQMIDIEWDDEDYPRDWAEYKKAMIDMIRLESKQGVLVSAEELPESVQMANNIQGADSLDDMFDEEVIRDCI